jgi:hypothetical protein
MNLAKLLRNNGTDVSNGGLSREKTPFVENQLPFLSGQISPLLRMVILVNQVIGSYLGLDPTMILTTFGSIWAICKLK